MQVLLLIVFIIGQSCQHEAVSIDDLPTMYFDKDILPIFQANCAGCHNGGDEEGLNFSSYSGIISKVDKGNPAGSELYQVITSNWDDPMPPDNPLTIGQRAKIRLWIEQGAQNNKKPDTTANNDTTNNEGSYKVCFKRDILPVISSSCAVSGCHDNITHEDGLVLNTYNNIMSIVSAGNPSSSKLYNVITDNGEDKMPPWPGNKLAQADIDSIYKWIQNGALNENCPSPCDTSKYTFTADIFPIISKNCTGCHNNTSASAGIKLVDYTSISSVAASGALVGSIKGSGYIRMPQAPISPLPDCKISQIENWVNAGYKNN